MTASARGLWGSSRTSDDPPLRMMPEGYVQDWVGGRLLPEFTLEQAEPSAELIYQTRELHRLILGAINVIPDRTTRRRSASLLRRAKS